MTAATRASKNGVYVNLEYHEYECPYWRLGKSHGPCTCHKEQDMRDVTPWSHGLFKLGNRVTWTSQSAGSTATKEGFVVEIVAPGAKPTGIRGAGCPRDHESYVVRGNTPRRKGHTKLYWPLVRHLQKAHQTFNERTLREEIVRIWGPAGAHVGLFDTMMARIMAGRAWEAVVNEELRSAKAGGAPIAIRMAEWGVKIVTAINAGRAPDGKS